jgi:hypothetical protein
MDPPQHRLKTLTVLASAVAVLAGVTADYSNGPLGNKPHVFTKVCAQKRRPLGFFLSALSFLTHGATLPAWCGSTGRSQAPYRWLYRKRKQQQDTGGTRDETVRCGEQRDPHSGVSHLLFHACLRASTRPASAGVEVVQPMRCSVRHCTCTTAIAAAACPLYIKRLDNSRAKCRVARFSVAARPAVLCSARTSPHGCIPVHAPR